MEHATTTHDQLQAALDLAGVELRASEVHGLVCGEICRRIKVGPDADFRTLVGVTEPVEGSGRAVLNVVDTLMQQTRQALDGGMQFSLLLPDDDEPVHERTGSVADWAKGFSVALLRGDKVAIEDLAANSAEIVRDLLKISEAAPGDESEDDERALTEIEEYMRVGVQLIFEEMQPDDDPGPSDRSIH